MRISWAFSAQSCVRKKKKKKKATRMVLCIAFHPGHVKPIGAIAEWRKYFFILQYIPIVLGKKFIYLLPVFFIQQTTG
jgi:hypothetical protein